MTPDDEHRSERFLLRAATTLLSEQNRKDTASFNLFTVLRSGSDEVNLHSRFLHALLDHRTGGQRKNLEAFLKLECLELREGMRIDSKKAKVQREKRDIDLLVTDESSKCALVIENKIYAGDQRKQLYRYYCDSELKSFRRHVIYLTLDGHEPTAGSQEGVPKKHLSCVSYAALDPWLQGCHDRTDDEPELRSSITQYRKLVRGLTGDGFGSERRKHMKELIRKTGSLELARQLGTAADELLVEIVEELWKEIESAITKKFGEEVEKGIPSDTSRERIEAAFDLRTHRPKWHGLYYPLNQKAERTGLGPAPALGIEIGSDGFWLGIRHKRDENEDAYGDIHCALREGRAPTDSQQTEWWPWRERVEDYSRLTDERIAALGCDAERTKVAQGIARELRCLWNALKKDETTRDLF